MLRTLATCGMPARKLLPAVPAATLDLVRACEDERGVDVSGMPREERRALQSLYCASADYNQQFETYDEKLDLAQFSDWLRALWPTCCAVEGESEEDEEEDEGEGESEEEYDYDSDDSDDGW